MRLEAAGGERHHALLDPHHAGFGPTRNSTDVRSLRGVELRELSTGDGRPA